VQGISILEAFPTLRPQLALLLSNRAAARLSLGKPADALQDCQMGMEVIWARQENRSSILCFSAKARVSAPPGLLIAVRPKPLPLRPAAGLLPLPTGRFRRREPRIGEAARQSRRRAGHLCGMLACTAASGACWDTHRVPFAAAGDPALLATVRGKVAEVQQQQHAYWSALHSADYRFPEGVPRAYNTLKGCSLQDGLAGLLEAMVHAPQSEALRAAKAETLLRLGRWVCRKPCPAPKNGSSFLAFPLLRSDQP
jgi:hypothetical protein